MWQCMELGDPISDHKVEANQAASRQAEPQTEAQSVA
jgi:hypothetical protein